ncbi:hypothetical protein BH23ACT12_BH23ACT12_00030 [soil metagenome]
MWRCATDAALLLIRPPVSQHPAGKGLVSVSTDRVRQHFDSIAPNYGRWKQKAHYYYDYVKAAVADVVPPGARVLEVGCGTGDVIAHLRPQEGLGIDLSPEMIVIAQTRHPRLNFAVHDLMGDSLSGTYDFVVAVDVAEHVPDLTRLMVCMASVLAPGGRIVLTTAHPSWRPVLELAERLKLKMPEGDHHWRTPEELRSAAAAAGLHQVCYTRLLVVPKSVPVLRSVNRIQALSQRIGLIQRAVLERTAPHA